MSGSVQPAKRAGESGQVLVGLVGGLVAVLVGVVVLGRWRAASVRRARRTAPPI